MTTSYEKTIIDGELIQRIKRIRQGLEGHDKEMSLDVIREVGHDDIYLTHPVTFKHCRERWTPSLSFWGSYEDWEAEGAEDVVQRANKKVKEILANAPESLLDPDVEKELKSYMKSE